MEAKLRDIAAGRSDERLRVTYSDVHGLWGGVAITLTGAGEYEQTARGRGGSTVVTRRRVAPGEVAAITRLLVEIEAWEQRVAPRMPVPDESQASITLRCGDDASSIWEWYNDLEANGRLVRVRDALLKLGEAGS